MKFAGIAAVITLFVMFSTLAGVYAPKDEFLVGFLCWPVCGFVYRKLTKLTPNTGASE